MATDFKAKLQPYIDQLESELHKKNKVTEYLAQAEQATGIKRINIVLAAVGLLGIIFLFSFGSELMMNFIAFLYPAYRSVRAIESKTPDDDTQWLIYWVVYSYLQFAEIFIDIVLWWFPFYYSFKLILVAWCMAPMKQNGSIVIYQNLVRPLVQKYGAVIEEQEKGLREAAMDIGDSLYKQADSTVRQRAAKVIEDQTKQALDSFTDSTMIPPEIKDD